MGNQYFQAFCAIAYALKHGLDYHIPAHTLNDSVWNPAITHLENPEWNPSVQTIILTEKSHAYEEIPFKEEWRNINIVIDGYRQSELYFNDYLPYLRDIFLNSANDLVGFVALHKRLGDYKNYPTRHPIITDEYISLSLKEMSKYGYSKCIVFSDNIEECISTINSDVYKGWTFLYSIGNDTKNDFDLMCSCSAFIISNSTFSLIAAILSDSQNKICISPSKENWFGEDNKQLSTETIIPNYFHQIKY
jgi:hypothetical protein